MRKILPYAAFAAIAISSAAFAQDASPKRTTVPVVENGVENVDLEGVTWTYVKVKVPGGYVLARCRLLEGGRGHCEGKAAK